LAKDGSLLVLVALHALEDVVQDTDRLPNV
jgi:hypothetical protein